MELYEQQPTRYPPTNWRKPPPAGYIDAHGMRRESQEPWRPVGLPTLMRLACLHEKTWQLTVPG